MKKTLHITFLVIFNLIITFYKTSYAQTYTPLYTGATFDAKTIDVNLPVGAINGSPNVSNGASSYTIPIAIPPGTNGIVPSVSVSYNSFGGNGVLGQGWSLSASSIITRVGKSIFHDGIVGGVNLDNNDKFALDGLRMIDSLVGGYITRRYLLENENHARITAYGNIGSGPEYFKVVSKDGTIMEYGNTADSRFTTPNGSVVISWFLNKVIYKDGNYLEYIYSNYINQTVLTKIKYTGNLNANLFPYNLIEFNYRSRTDNNSSYLANVEVENKFLLESIKTFVDYNYTYFATNIPEKQYIFNYGYNKTTSYLKEVVEKDSANIALNATIFKYGDNPATFFKEYNLLSQITDYTSASATDIDGDGKQEIVYYLGGSYTSHSFKILKQQLIPNNASHVLTTIPQPLNYTIRSESDFNGDGNNDFLFYRANDFGDLGDLLLYTSPASGFSFAPPVTIANNVSLSPWTRVHDNGNFMVNGDFNGDGKSDIITFFLSGANPTISENRIFLNGNSTSVTTLSGLNSWFTFSKWHTAKETYVLDFNGDGKDDVMLIDDSNTEIFTYDPINNNYASLYHSSYAGYPNKYQMIKFADFNGDGKIDLLTRSDKNVNSSSWSVALSTGTSFVTTPFVFNQVPDLIYTSGGSSIDKLFIGDYNGDGKSDICHIFNYGNPQQSKIDIYYRNGNGFIREQSLNPKPIAFGLESSFVLDSDGDGRSEIFSHAGGPQNNFDLLKFNNAGKERLLHKVKTGVGNITEFNYKRLSEEGTFYTRGPVGGYPINNLRPAIPAVSQSKIANGIGGYTTINYKYETLRIHKLGKGSLGFTKIIAENITSGFRSIQENEFSLVHFAPVLKKTQTYRISGNTLLSETNYTNTFIDNLAGYKSFWIKTSSIIENNLFGQSFVNSSFTFDDFGNMLTKISNINNLEEVTITNEIEPTVPNVVPYKVKSTTTSKKRLTEPIYSFTTDYTYTPNGKLSKEIKFFGLPKKVETEYGYHPNLGNITSIIVSATGLQNRTSTTLFDSKGRFPNEIFNTLNQKTLQNFEPIYGNVINTTGLDGLLTSYEYDSWGRLTKTNVPEGFSILESYGWDINPTEGTTYFKLTTHPGKPDVKVWFDQLGRERKRQIEGHLNEWITSKTTYDAKGNIATTTAPYKASETVLTTTNQYDEFNRITTSSNTLGSTGVVYVYNTAGELTTTTTAPDLTVSSKQSDAAGKLLKATDNGGTLTYTYNSQGNLRQIANATQTLVINKYDEYGRQYELNDANAGITQYDYDAYGQLITQINPAGQTTSIVYDNLGRVEKSTKPEGITNTIYFPPNSGASTNKIKTITGFALDINEYTYDALGRLKTEKTTIDGVAHEFINNYNAHNLTSRNYPFGFSLYYTNDANGYLTEIRDQTYQIKLFENLGMNGLGQYKSYKLGNNKTSINTYYHGIPTNYSTPSIQNLSMAWNYTNGNLNSRTDGIKSKTESFTYDNLDRLKGSSGTGLATTSMVYEPNGNISQKSDAGTYDYHYAKFNALDYIAGPLNISNNLQTITYTSYAQPNLILQGLDRVEYTYGADEQRIKAITKVSNTITNTRYYFGDYEKDITNGVTKHIFYISAGDGLVAIAVRENNANIFRYVYTDHLGSIVALTDSIGTITSEQNFDAWGRKRNPTNWTYTSIPAVQAWLKRGYSGHEH